MSATARHDVTITRMARLTGNDVLLGPEKIRHTLLLDVRVILLELVGEAESNHRQTGVVRLARVAFVVLLLAWHELEVSLLPVDIRDTSVPPGMLQSSTQQPSIRQHVLHDAAVAGETEMDEVVVLCDDLCSRAREVECVRLLSSSQIMELKDQVLGKIALVSPDNPTHAGIYEAELVTAGVD
jgi:hypothetical protein